MNRRATSWSRGGGPTSRNRPAATAGNAGSNSRTKPRHDGSTTQPNSRSAREVTLSSWKVTEITSKCSLSEFRADASNRSR